MKTQACVGVCLCIWLSSVFLQEAEGSRSVFCDSLGLGAGAGLFGAVSQKQPAWPTSPIA